MRIRYIVAFVVLSMLLIFASAVIICTEVNLIRDHRSHDDLVAENQALSSTNQELLHKLADMNAQNIQNTSLDVINVTYDSKVKDLQISDLQQQNNEKLSNIAQLNSQIAVLSSDISNKTLALETLSIDYSKSQSLIADQKLLISQLNIQISDLSNNITNNLRTIETLKLNLNNAQINLANMTAQNALQMQQINALNTQITSQNLQTQLFQNQLKIEKANSDNLQSQIASLKSQIQALADPELLFVDIHETIHTQFWFWDPPNNVEVKGYVVDIHQTQASGWKLHLYASSLNTTVVIDDYHQLPVVPGEYFVYVDYHVNYGSNAIDYMTVALTH